MNIERSLYPKLLESLKTFPVVGLVGPRQVGKTSLARQLVADLAQAGKSNSDETSAMMLDLERPSDLAKLTEPELFLEPLANRLVVLDEVQLRPDLFPVLRALVDAQRTPGRFLILGSAAPALIQHSSETLAGRIEFLELAPLNLTEVALNEASPDVAQTLWSRGGFPDSYLARSDAASMRWREAFVRSYLERDIPQLGIRVSAATLRRFWLMLAHYHGQLWNASTLAGSLGVSAPSVRHYLDILESTFMVRVLQPYSANLGKRLVKSPKVYLRDSGLLHALLNLPDRDALLGHPVLGASWEGWVIEQILALAPDGTRPYFYRTASGNELDLLLELPGGALRAVEIKHSAAPKVGKGFNEALDALKLEKGFVIAPVDAAYPLSQRAQVLPLSKLTELWT
jgi:predicted AAA+ superfamily ATPase